MMKKKLKIIFSFATLALSCINSFGQKITVVNFTGCLATTTFCQWSSTGQSQDQATAGWVSAIAAPSVDVSKISDLKIDLESNTNKRQLRATSVFGSMD